TRVLYPFRPDHPQHNLAKAQMEGGGGVVTFEIAGGKPAAFKFANGLKLIDISNNLGDTKSLITHPETTTHQKLTPAAPADLCEDLEDALKAAQYVLRGSTCYAQVSHLRMTKPALVSTG